VEDIFSIADCQPSIVSNKEIIQVEYGKYFFTPGVLELQSKEGE
jgi:hypothetical protein